MPKIEDPHINPLGFREYDARWLYPKDINKEGVKIVGQGLGSQIISKTNKSPRVIVGHDYRSYSEEIKQKLIEGLIDTGCNIEDIGLALSPTAYFAQFNLDADAVAMVTASHNENGWTGIKMGIEKGLTHSPAEMNELKKIVSEKKFTKGKGSYKEIKGFKDIYINNLIKHKIKKKLKVVVACGNGTAGVFAPKVLREIGEERQSKKIAKLICNKRKEKAIKTTKDLSDIILSCKKRSSKIHPATNVFRAVRMRINHELEELNSVLGTVGEVLKIGGRLAVISFHSLEDRIVKRFIQGKDGAGIDSTFKLVGGKPIKPNQDEIKENPRSRSAIMRVAERVA